VKVLGVITSALISSLAVLGAVVVVMSLPDVRRYLKMRSM
jgi:hypothetical protein